MLHLALVAPADRAARIVELLTEHPGVADVVHLRGAAVQPKGDLIEADVAREAADDVLEQVKPLCVEGGGVVRISDVSAAVGRPVTEAEKNAPGEGVDAVIWEQVSQHTGEDSTLSATFLVFMIAATLICSVGLLIDSDVLIVGGMVLGPEFGPLAGIAIAIVGGRWRKARTSALALLVGFPLAVAVTAGAVALLGVTYGIPQGYLDGQRPLTSFVSHPDVLSVVVALIAGVAGTVSLTSSKSGSLVGVFISVTTIPAAANIGTALVTGRGSEAAGAALQLGVNLLCVLVSATITLTIQRAVQRRWHRVSPLTRR